MSKAKLSRRGVLAALAASPAAVEFLRSAVAEAQTSLSQSGLVGEIQGPTIITDPAKWPKKFAEAPMLAELVKAGKLPPVEQRVPAEPLVWQPLNEIGKYGGTWRRAFTGPADGENGNRIQSSDKPLHWSADGSKIVPCVAKGYELSDDGKTYTLYLRKGMKWSDGSPFTADDFIFWFEDIYSNPEIVPTPTPEMRPAGETRPHGQGGRDHGALGIRRAVFPVRGNHGRRHRHGWRTGRPSGRQGQLRRLCARPLPQAVPAEILVRRGGERARETGRVSRTGCRCCTSRRTGNSTPTCRCSGRGAACGRSTTRSGCWSGIRTTTPSIRRAISCRISTGCSSRLPRTSRSSTCARWPGNTTSRSGISTWASCRCCSITRPRATTRSIWISDLPDPTSCST